MRVPRRRSRYRCRDVVAELVGPFARSWITAVPEKYKRRSDLRGLKSRETWPRCRTSCCFRDRDGRKEAFRSSGRRLDGRPTDQAQSRRVAEGEGLWLTHKPRKQPPIGDSAPFDRTLPRPWFLGLLVTNYSLPVMNRDSDCVHRTQLMLFCTL